MSVRCTTTLRTPKSIENNQHRAKLSLRGKKQARTWFPQLRRQSSGFFSVSCALPSPPPENFVVALDVIVGKYNTATPAYDMSWSRVKLGISVSVERSL